MELRDYLNPMTTVEVEAFAVEVGTTVGHLRNVAYGTRIASAALARQIDVRSGGRVPVSVTRKRDWHLIWDGFVNQSVQEGAIVSQIDAQPIAPMNSDAKNCTLGVAALPTEVSSANTMPAGEISHVG